MQQRAEGKGCAGIFFYGLVFFSFGDDPINIFIVFMKSIERPLVGNIDRNGKEAEERQ